MKPEKKIRNALIKLYWQAHNDGGLAEFEDNIGEHLRSKKWADRRASVIGDVLQVIQSAQQSVQLTAATPRKNGAKSKAVKAVKSRRN